MNTSAPADGPDPTQPVQQTQQTQQQQPSYSLNSDDYQVGKIIGFGSSAVVHLAVYRPNQQSVAIKLIDLDMFERNQIDELRRELQVMSLCKHDNLLSVRVRGLLL